MEEEVHVFVYGTLRSGGRAAGLMRGCELLGVRRARGTLYGVRGAYPALVLAGEGTVEGEVWRCPAAVLERLDEYEGVAEGLFRRVPLEVEGVECQAYVAGPALAAHLNPEGVVPSGRWGPEGAK